MISVYTGLMELQSPSPPFDGIDRLPEQPVPSRNKH